MKILDPENNVVEFFNTHENKDIVILRHHLNKKHFPIDSIYVAAELIQNAVNAVSNRIDGRINCGSVSITVYSKKFEEVDFYTKLAKFSYLNKENISSVSKSSKSGKGIISIFLAGWDIIIEKINEDQFKVIATKKL